MVNNPLIRPYFLGGGSFGGGGGVARIPMILGVTQKKCLGFGIPLKPKGFFKYRSSQELFVARFS